MKIQKLVVIAIASMMCWIPALRADVRVLDIQGTAAFKDQSQWKPVKKGQALKEGTKISTGARSSVRLKIDNATVTIRQLSMVRINRNLATGSATSTNLGLRYGKINARIDRIKKLRTDFRISTPVATSSVRGTEEEVSFGPGRGMIVQVLHGEVGASNRFGTSNIVRKGMKFHVKQGSPRPSPLLLSTWNKFITRVDPDDLTDEEKQILERFGDDLWLNFEDPQFTSNSRAKAKVNLQIIFP